VSVFAGVGERTREGNDLWNEMKETGVLNKTVLVFGQMLMRAIGLFLTLWHLRWVSGQVAQ